MKIFKLCIVSALICFVSACATTAKYERVLNSWLGADSDRLVSAWGPPTSSYDLSNGGKVLEYVWQGNMQLGGYTYTVPQTTYYNGNVNVYGNRGFAYGNYMGSSTTYVQQTSPTYNIPLSCTTLFTTNSAGIITNWRWQGNNCKTR